MKLDEKGNIVEQPKEEEIQPEENTNAEINVTKDESDEDQSKDTKKASDIDNKIDYAAELKKLREAKEKAEKALAGKRFKESENKRKSIEVETDIDEYDEDKPLTAKELQRILAQERQLTFKEVNQSKVSDIVKKYSSSDEEAELISEIHKSRTFPEYMSIEEQIEESYIIANKQKIIGENNELKRALNNKGNASNSSVSGRKDKMTGDEPQISSSSKQAITLAGYKYNAATRRYEKKLDNGQTLIYDAKAKQTRLV